MPTYKREKCLCCECKFYISPIITNLTDFTIPNILGKEKCKKGEIAIKDMVAKDKCKYFEAEEDLAVG